MSSRTKLDYFFAIILILICIGILILIIILFANRPKKLGEMKTDDVAISSFSSLNFIEIDSLPVYNESSSNLGLTGRLILDCFSGICQVEDFYYDIDEDLVEYYVDTLDYSCSQQCSYSVNKECDCNIDGEESKGECSRKYDDQYEKGKYCYTDNVIYNWKGKKYTTVKKDILTYYNHAKLKDEECPSGTIDCGIIDDNENKLCISSRSNCPINYLSENQTNSNKIHSTVNIGNKTFYYTFDDDNKMKRKIIAGLVADTDLYLNKDNKEKVIIDTDTISGFLADNKNLYKQVKLGYDPYKDENIDKRGKSYLRIFYNKKVNLQELRDNINTYNSHHRINKDAINPVRKYTKFVFVFGLISYLSFLITIALYLTASEYKGIGGVGYFFVLFFIVFYIVSFIYICINISKFNKLKKTHNFPRIINLIIFILYLVLIAYSIFLYFYANYLRDKFRDCCCNICNKKNEVNNATITNEAIKEKN